VLFRSRELEFAAHLHDIGKIARLRQTAKKKRTSAENNTRDALVGASILGQISGFETISRIVRHQNEHYNGSGTPDGLTKSKIPLASRIIAAANMYDIAVYGGLHPTELDHDAGMKALTAGAKSTLDPEIVGIILDTDFLEESTHGEMTEVEVSPRQLRSGMILARDLLNITGMLLLKSGTKMTPQVLERIAVLTDDHQLTPSIMVQCSPTNTEPPADTDTKNTKNARRCA